MPNVIYSCGSLLHGRQLIIPYAMSDYATTFARCPWMSRCPRWNSLAGAEHAAMRPEVLWNAGYIVVLLMSDNGGL